MLLGYALVGLGSVLDAVLKRSAFWWQKLGDLINLGLVKISRRIPGPLGPGLNSRPWDTASSVTDAPGVYQVTHLLPPEGKVFQYRIKTINEPP